MHLKIRGKEIKRHMARVEIIYIYHFWRALKACVRSKRAQSYTLGLSPGLEIELESFQETSSTDIKGSTFMILSSIEVPTAISYIFNPFDNSTLA